MSRKVLYLTADLFFSSRVIGAGASEGLQVDMVGTIGDAVARARGEDVALLLLDLTLPGCRPADVLEAWNELPSPPPVVAYGPHVAETQLAAAREAGCAEVLTRGQFDQRMHDVLRRYAAGE